MPVTVFSNVQPVDRRNAVDRLISGSTGSQDFFLMVILSVLVATFGLLDGDGAVIIGSMLIAPILYPVLSLSLAIVMADGILIKRSLWTFFRGIVISIVSANIASLLFAGQYTHLTEEILFRTEPTITSVAVSVVAGFAASFALVKPHLNENLPGVAISVALIPPLAVTGIGIAQLDIIIASGGFLVFLINTIGIMFASMITFSLMNFHTQKNRAEKTAKEEDQKVEKEIKEARVK